MQCKCGGETRTSEAVQTKLKAVLFFYECKNCLRVSSAELEIRGVSVAKDPEARGLFQGLDQAQADALYASATQPPESEVEPNATGDLFSMV